MTAANCDSVMPTASLLSIDADVVAYATATADTWRHVNRAIYQSIYLANCEEKKTKIRKRPKRKEKDRQA